MSTNGTREIIADPPIRGIWEDEYPSQYDKDEVRRVIREEIAEALTNVSIAGLLVDNTIPGPKIMRDTIGINEIGPNVVTYQRFVHNLISGIGTATGSFEVKHGQRVTFEFFLSGYTSSAGSMQTAQLTLDGAATTSSSAFIYMNEANSHKAFVPGSHDVTNMAVGTHTYGFTGAGTGQTFDTNDYLIITIMELPGG